MGGASAPFSLTGVGADTYTISAVYNPGSGFPGSNNSGQAPAPTLTISKATLVVTPDAKTRTYGQAAPAYTFSVTGFQNSETAGTAAGYVAPTCTSDYTPTTPVSASPRTITCSGGSANNYMFNTTATAQLSVGARTLTITADDQTKTYGETFTFDGDEFDTGAGQLVNGDTVTSVSLTSAGAAASALVGDYPIVASAAVGSGLANYAIGYVDGNLEVTKRTLTITADDQTKTYGETFTFDGDEFDTGAGQLVNGDTVTSVSLTSAGAAASASVGDYRIVASAAVGSDPANYAIGYVDGNLEVTKRTLTITADDQTKTYGETFTFDGDEFDTGAGRTVSWSTATPPPPVSLTSVGDAPPVGDSTAASSGHRLRRRQPRGHQAAYDPADDQTKTYGETFTFDGDEFDTGAGQLVNGDTVTSVSLTSAGAAASAPSATTPIVASAAVGSDRRTTPSATSTATSRSPSGP